MAPKDLPDELEQYRKAVVKKHFPGFGTFDGYVDKIEKDTDEDHKIFFVKYPTDGDREWVDLEELKKIVQKDGDQIMYYDPNQASGSKRKKKDAPASAGKRAKASKSPKASKDKAPASSKAAAAETTSTAKASPAAATKQADKAAAKPAPAGKAGRAADQQATVSGSQESHKGKAAAEGKAAANGGGAASVASPPAGRDSAATPSAAKAKPAAAAHSAAAEVPAASPAGKEAAAPAAKPKEPAGAPGASNKSGAAPAAPAAPASAADAAAAPTNYAQVVVKDNLVFLAGQAASDTTSASGCTYEGQIKQVFAQIDKLLQDVGSSKDHLATVTVFLRDLDVGVPVFNSLWDSWVNPAQLPARTMVKADMVGQEVLVEINCIASKPRRPSGL